MDFTFSETCIVIHISEKDQQMRPFLVNSFHLNYSLHSWIKIDQLDVTRFIISSFIAQHVSNFSTSIFRSLRLTVDLFHVLYFSGSMCVGVTVWFGWGGVVSLCRLKRASACMMHDPINLIFSACFEKIVSSSGGYFRTRSMQYFSYICGVSSC